MLRVFFTDAVGNAGSEGVSEGLLLDTAPPGGAAISGPVGPSQSRAPAWTFLAEPATVARCRLSRGATVVVDWTACSAGTSADLTGLPDGEYVLEVELTDEAGNTTTRSSDPYLLDTTAPDATVVRGPAGPSQDARPGFTWTVRPGRPPRAS